MVRAQSHKRRLTSPSARRPREANTYVGLDIHRKSIVATALDKHGETLGEAKLSPSSRELNDILRPLPGTKHAFREPCTIWEPLYESLEGEGVEAPLTHPLRTRLIADATIKTDRIDGLALATLLRLGAIARIHVPEAESRALRHLVLERYFYRCKMTAVLSRTMLSSCGETSATRTRHSSMAALACRSMRPPSGANALEMKYVQEDPRLWRPCGQGTASAHNDRAT